MKEIKDSKYLYSNIKDDVLRQRIQNSINWYIHKSVFYKRFYYIFSTISILLPLGVTILHSTDSACFLENHLQICSAILASATTLTTSILTLFRFQDYWKEYRETAEKLKAELLQFHMGIGKYQDRNQDMMNLAVNVETIILNSKRKEKEIIETTPKVYIGKASGIGEDKLGK